MVKRLLCNDSYPNRNLFTPQETPFLSCLSRKTPENSPNKPHISLLRQFLALQKIKVISKNNHPTPHFSSFFRRRSKSILTEMLLGSFLPKESSKMSNALSIIGSASVKRFKAIST